jgi:hypothetical protein
MKKTNLRKTQGQSRKAVNMVVMTAKKRTTKEMMRVKIHQMH